MLLISLAVLVSVAVLVDAAKRSKRVEKKKAGGTRETLDPYKKEVVVGDTTFHPSFGIFPKGCRWRVVSNSNSSDVDYQVLGCIGSHWEPECTQ